MITYLTILNKLLLMLTFFVHFFNLLIIRTWLCLFLREYLWLLYGSFLRVFYFEFRCLLSGSTFFFLIILKHALKILIIFLVINISK